MPTDAYIPKPTLVGVQYDCQGKTMMVEEFYSDGTSKLVFHYLD